MGPNKTLTCCCADSVTTCQDEPLLQGYSYMGAFPSPLPGNVIEEGTKSVVLPESKEGSFRPVSRASALSLGPVPSDPGLRERRNRVPHTALCPGPLEGCRCPRLCGSWGSLRGQRKAFLCQGITYPPGGVGGQPGACERHVLGHCKFPEDL